MKFTDYKDYNPHVALCDNIPEIETYFITLPTTPPPIEKFKNYGKEVMKQIYYRDRVPDKLMKLNRLDRDEAFAVAMKDKECADFIAMAWDKRLNGEWVLINGNPLYITGSYYFYLNFYQLDIGFPAFRYNDLKQFWLWDFEVVKNNRVYGLCDLNRRRSGKTYKAGSILLDYVTRNENSFAGAQSKSDADAESLFHKAIVSPFRKLPFFFKPTYDKAGKMKKDIAFTDNGVTEGTLESWIDYRSSTDTAYDGEKLHRYFMDEGGKMKPPADPVKMWDKVKPCLIEDDKIIGKCIVSTTIEEMEKGGLEKFIKLWADSSRLEADGKINELGETLSGLIPYFTPSYECYLWDRFGYPIIDNPSGYQLEDRRKQCSEEDFKLGLDKLGAKEYLDLKFRSIKDQRKKQDEIRKFPRTVTEAFRSSATHCHFNLGIINDRMSEYLFDKEKGKVRGNFEWKDGQEDTEVIWRPTPNGRWLMAYVLDQEQSNRKGENGGKRMPLNFDKFVIGCDPFKYNVTTSNKPSHGAGYQWMYFDQSIDGQKDEIDWLTDDFVGEYLYRPATTDLFAEDMLMWAIYSSCKVNPEMNADIISKHFVRRGYEKYLHYGKKLVKKDGVVQIKENINSGATTLGGAMKDSLFASVDWYIETHGNRCKFPNFLTDCREVGYDNISPFDSFVAGAYTLMPVRELKTRTKKEPVSFRSFMQMRKY
jgi:hypothetical protein